MDWIGLDRTGLNWAGPDWTDSGFGECEAVRTSVKDVKCYIAAIRSPPTGQGQAVTTLRRSAECSSAHS